MEKGLVSYGWCDVCVRDCMQILCEDAPMHETVIIQVRERATDVVYVWTFHGRIR